jgi:hypothetical protein
MSPIEDEDRDEEVEFPETLSRIEYSIGQCARIPREGLWLAPAHAVWVCGQWSTFLSWPEPFDQAPVECPWLWMILATYIPCDGHLLMAAQAKTPYGTSALQD